MFTLRTKTLSSALVLASALAAACSSTGGSEDVAISASESLVSCGSVVQPSQNSMFVVDSTALTEFPLEDVLNQIVATGAQGSDLTGLALYQQLMDTLNDKAHAFTDGPHCDDNGGDINGFPIKFCPRQEGILAGTNPFGTDANSFHTLGIVNRFDLAPSDGSNCGQYRVVFGKNSGNTNAFDRTLIIFEAVLANPHPEKGLAACAPVANFWDQLTSDASAASRAKKLRNFYFNGISGFSPVIQASNYGPTTGQIRANLFMNSTGQQEWELREFKLFQACARGVQPDGGGTECTLVANNTAVQDNPDGTLFGGSSQQAQTFQQEFISQVASLAADDVNLIAMTTPLVDNSAQSDEQDNSSDYDAQGNGNTSLTKAITKELTRIGNTTLNAKNILDRATTQGCAGCHEVAAGRALGGGVTFPRSNGFTQIDEKSNLSPALGVFIPAREQVLFNFLESVCKGNEIDANPAKTIGGGAVGAAN